MQLLIIDIDGITAMGPRMLTVHRIGAMYFYCIDSVCEILAPWKPAVEFPALSREARFHL